MIRETRQCRSCLFFEQEYDMPNYCALHDGKGIKDSMFDGLEKSKCPCFTTKEKLIKYVRDLPVYQEFIKTRFYTPKPFKAKKVSAKKLSKVYDVYKTNGKTIYFPKEI